MAIEPTSVQRDKMLAIEKTRITLVQFLVPKESVGLEGYFDETARALLGEEGTRDHQFKIDQALTAGDYPHQYLVVDSFPSSQALLMAHEKTRDIRQTTLQEVYAILVKPDKMTTRTTNALGKFRSLFTHLVDTSEIKKLDGLSGQLDPETDPDLDQISSFGKTDLEKPFTMMNLNQFNPAGKKIYKQYSLRITPYLISVGGYPVLFGSILGTYIGNEKSRLFNQWAEFGLVYYPSRTNFLRMMTNTPSMAAKTRRAGLKKAILMACS